MASARVTANIAVQALFTVPLHKKAVIDSVTVDNEGTSGPITVQLEDDFTQDISYTNGTPTSRSAFPYQLTVPQNAVGYSDKNSTDKIKCLGNVGAIASVTDGSCDILVDYHFEE